MDKVCRARELRRDGSRGKDLLGFRRQHPIGPYFADFACISKKLVIEIDGEQLRWNAKDGESCDSGPTKLFKIAKAHGRQLKSRRKTACNPLTQPLPLAGERSMKGEAAREARG